MKIDEPNKKANKKELRPLFFPCRFATVLATCLLLSCRSSIGDINEWLHEIEDRNSYRVIRDADKNIVELYLHDLSIRDKLPALSKLDSLQSLSLHRTDIKDADLKHLYDMHSLQYIGLENTGVSMESISSMRAILPNTTIRTGASIHTEDDYQWLITNPRVKQFRTLFLHWPIPAEEFAIIGKMKGLKDARIQLVDPTDEHYRIISQLSNLEFLSLTTRSNMSDTALHSIGQLKQLRRLELKDTNLLGLNTSVLSNCTNLRELNLSNTGVTDREVLMIKLHNLKALDLHLTSITGTSGEMIAKQRQLQVLDLDATQFDDDGIQAIADISEIHNLSLVGTRITDKSASILGNFKKLGSLYLRDTRMTNVRVFELILSLPNIGVCTLPRDIQTPYGRAALNELLSKRPELEYNKEDNYIYRKVDK